jgi:hypothetical protein
MAVALVAVFDQPLVVALSLVAAVVVAVMQVLAVLDIATQVHHSKELLVLAAAAVAVLVTTVPELL